MEYTEGKHLSIKSWSVEERPREKMALQGCHSLSNAELIAIIVGSGSKRETAVELGRRVLNHFGGSLRNIESASLNDLTRISGIGMASATRIMAAFMLGRRQRAEEIPKRSKILSANQAWEIIQPVFAGKHHEEFWIALLNRANMLIRTVQISRGGISGTIVDSKLIYSLVLEHKASAMILFHNHPSGNTAPSEADKNLTSKMCQIAKVLEVQILDHIIAGDENYFSFADNGLI